MCNISCNYLFQGIDVFYWGGVMNRECGERGVVEYSVHDVNTYIYTPRHIR